LYVHILGRQLESKNSTFEKFFAFSNMKAYGQARPVHVSHTAGEGEGKEGRKEFLPSKVPKE
jgi:hypothetical protein